MAEEEGEKLKNVALKLNRRLDEKFEVFSHEYNLLGCLPSFGLLAFGFIDIFSDTFIAFYNIVGESSFSRNLLVLNIVFLTAICLRELLALLCFFGLIKFPTRSDVVVSESVLLSTFAFMRRLRITCMTGTIYYSKLKRDPEKLQEMGLTKADLDDRVVHFSEAKKVTEDTAHVVSARCKQILDCTICTAGERSAVVSDKIEEEDEEEVEVITWGGSWGLLLWIALCYAVHLMSLAITVGGIFVLFEPFRELAGFNCELEEFPDPEELVIIWFAYLTTLQALYLLTFWVFTFSSREEDTTTSCGKVWDQYNCRIISVYILIGLVAAHAAAIALVSGDQQAYGCFPIVNSTT